MKGQFVHSEQLYNLAAPQEIVPIIMKLLNPKSVVDIGCGIGTFLYSFKQLGVTNLLGVDGPWVDKKILYKYLDQTEFLEVDLEKGFTLSQKFDLVLSLEVAEHLPEHSADSFVKNLVSAGEIILFSAAIPLQGGQDHINEQWLTYWEEKFLKNGYIMQDVLRPIFWDNPAIFWWYKQNMVLVTPREFKFAPKVKYNHLKNVVHYDLFIEKSHRLNKLTSALNDIIKRLEKQEDLEAVKRIIGSENYEILEAYIV